MFAARADSSQTRSSVESCARPYIPRETAATVDVTRLDRRTRYSRQYGAAFRHSDFYSRSPRQYRRLTFERFANARAGSCREMSFFLDEKTGFLFIRHSILLVVSLSFRRFNNIPKKCICPGAPVYRMMLDVSLPGENGSRDGLSLHSPKHFLGILEPLSGTGHLVGIDPGLVLRTR